MRSAVRLSTLCLVLVGMADLVSTLVWLHGGNAEGNPFFARLAHQGAIAFAIGKLVFLVGPILVLEYAYKLRPRTVEFATWFATFLYLALLGTHIHSVLGPR